MKKRSLSRGRYTVVVFVEEVRLVTVRRREVVSMVLRKAGVANMIYGQDGAQRDKRRISKNWKMDCTGRKPRTITIVKRLFSKSRDGESSDALSRL